MIRKTGSIGLLLFFLFAAFTIPFLLFYDRRHLEFRLVLVIVPLGLPVGEDERTVRHSPDKIHLDRYADIFDAEMIEFLVPQASSPYVARRKRIRKYTLYYSADPGFLWNLLQVIDLSLSPYPSRGADLSRVR